MNKDAKINIYAVHVLGTIVNEPIFTKVCADYDREFDTADITADAQQPTGIAAQHQTEH